MNCLQQTKDERDGREIVASPEQRSFFEGDTIVVERTAIRREWNKRVIVIIATVTSFLIPYLQLEYQQELENETEESVLDRWFQVTGIATTLIHVFQSWLKTYFRRAFHGQSIDRLMYCYEWDYDHKSHQQTGQS